MKKNQVDAIFIDQVNRRNTIIGRVCGIILVLVVAVCFLVLFFNQNRDYLVNYRENSNIDYQVYLKDNEFFGESYLARDNQYIASLIDYINTNFNYEIAMAEQDINYKYSYRIETSVDVIDLGSRKALYHKTEELKKVLDQNANSSKNVLISENLKLDYNEYNNLIKRFVNVYGLDEAENTLTVNMYIDVNGSCDEEKEYKNTESVISMVIPLTTKTVGIDIKNNIIESNENVLVCNDATPVVYLYLLFAGIIITMDIILTLDLIRYIVSTRTAETIYDIELKKILNNYHSYIQKVSNTMNLAGTKFEVDNLQTYKGCQFYKLETFTDMLEIRDSINSPILMASNSQNTATYFTILDVNNKAVYLYGIRVTDIKKQMKENMMDD